MLTVDPVRLDQTLGVLLVEGRLEDVEDVRGVVDGVFLAIEIARDCDCFSDLFVRACLSARRVGDREVGLRDELLVDELVEVDHGIRAGPDDLVDHLLQLAEVVRCLFVAFDGGFELLHAHANVTREELERGLPRVLWKHQVEDLDRPEGFFVLPCALEVRRQHRSGRIFRRRRDLGGCFDVGPDRLVEGVGVVVAVRADLGVFADGARDVARLVVEPSDRQVAQVANPSVLRGRCGEGQDFPEHAERLFVPQLRFSRVAASGRELPLGDDDRRAEVTGLWGVRRAARERPEDVLRVDELTLSVQGLAHLVADAERGRAVVDRRPHESVVVLAEAHHVAGPAEQLDQLEEAVPVERVGGADLHDSLELCLGGPEVAVQEQALGDVPLRLAAARIALEVIVGQQRVEDERAALMVVHEIRVLRFREPFADDPRAPCQGAGGDVRAKSGDPTLQANHFGFDDGEIALQRGGRAALRRRG